MPDLNTIIGMEYDRCGGDISIDLMLDHMNQCKKLMDADDCTSKEARHYIREIRETKKLLIIKTRV